MPLYIPPAIVTDPSVLKAEAVGLMEELLPGWRAKDASVEDAIFDAFSFKAAEQNEVLAEALTTGVYRGLGPLIGTAPIAAVAAASVATITFKDNAGYTIPEGGLVVGLHDANGDLIGFRSTGPLTVAPGSTTLIATLEAEEGGPSGNGLEGVALLVTAPGSVTSVSLATSGGGLEAESESSYLDRLTEDLALQRPAPVRAEEAAAIARNVAGIGRATAVDNLKPSAADGGEGTEETTVEKTITVAVTDANGVASDSTHKAAVKTLLEELREVNFRFFVVSPHYMGVDVKVKVYAWPGNSTATVKTNVEAALRAFLSPASFAADASGKPERWANEPILHAGDLYTVIGRVAGVRWAQELTFGKHGAGLATTDLNLAGASAVPALPLGDVANCTLTVTVEPS